LDFGSVYRSPGSIVYFVSPSTDTHAWYESYPTMSDSPIIGRYKLYKDGTNRLLQWPPTLTPTLLTY